MRYALYLVLLIGCGCATTPPDGDFSALYDGRPTTAFVTEFPAASAAEAIARGDRAFRSGEIDRALYLYLQAIEADPQRPEAFFRIGAIHEQRGKLELAANAFRQVLARDPGNAVAGEKLGLALLGQRELDQAKNRLEQAHTLDERRWKTINALGIIADLQGEHTQAAAYFRQALELEPLSAKVLTNLGYSLYLAGDWARAEQVLLQALEHAPAYELALRNLALLQSRRGNADLALALLLKVTGEAEAHNDVGYFFLIDGNYSLAENYFRRAVELSPSYYELAHRNLERAQTMLRDAGPAPERSRQARTRPAPGAALDSALFADGAAVAGTVQPAPAAARQSASPAGPEQPLYLKRWVNAGVLNVRDGDDPDARLLGRLRRGRVVRVLREENGWAYVRYWEYENDNVSAREGWVHADYLTDTQHRA